MRVSGQLRGATLLRCTVAAYPHVLQAMVTPPARMSCSRLGNV
jgi:hypothetical protein